MTNAEEKRSKPDSIEEGEQQSREEGMLNYGNVFTGFRHLTTSK